MSLDYVGVCLAPAGAPASSSGPAGPVLPFGGGCTVQVQFASGGSTSSGSPTLLLLAAGDVRSGVRAWQLIPPLTVGEKRAMHAEEEARRVVQTASVAGLEALRESERVAHHTAKERARAKAFQVEMERARELERAELEQERMDIVDDGEVDLLAATGAPIFHGGAGGVEAAIKKRRPSEMLTPTLAGGGGRTIRPAPHEEKGSHTERSTTRKDHKAAAAGGTAGIVPPLVPLSTSRLPDWMLDDDDDEEAAGDDERKGKKKRTKRHGAAAAAAARAADEAAGGSALASTSTKKFPSIAGATHGPSHPHHLLTPQPRKSKHRAHHPPTTTTSGAQTARPAAKQSTTHLAANGSSTAREASSTSPDLSARRGAAAGGMPSSRRRRDADDDHEDPTAMTTPSKKTLAPPPTTASHDDATGGSGGSKRSGRLNSRRAGAAGGDAPSPGSTTPARSSLLHPLSSTSTTMTTSPSTTNTMASHHHHQQQQQQTAAASSTGAIVAPFCYSDLPDPESLAFRLRIPATVQPPMARLLPPAMLTENASSPSSSLFAPLAGGGCFALSGDETILVCIPNLLDDGSAPSAGGSGVGRKLRWVERLKGSKVTTCEKAHNAPASCLDLTEDGRRCIVGTRSGHAYVHTLESAAGKWTYAWFKLHATDDPRPNLDLRYAPNGLALLVSRVDPAAPLTVWNVKSGKMLANCDGGSGAAAILAAAAAARDDAEGATGTPTPVTALPAHTSLSVKACWTPDSEHLVSVGWDARDRTVRLWKTVTRSLNPRMMCLGRLNTPYTHFRPPAGSSAATGAGGGGPDPFFSHAMCVSPNGKLVAVGLGVTLFIFSLATQRCLFYQTQFDLLSQGEIERDEEIGSDPGWIDPWLGKHHLLFPSTVVQLHAEEAIGGRKIIPDREYDQPLPTAQGAAAAAAASAAAATAATAAAAGVSKPILSKRASLTKLGMDGINMALSSGAGSAGGAAPSTAAAANVAISKRGSMGRDVTALQHAMASAALSKKGSMVRGAATSAAAGGTNGQLGSSTAPNGNSSAANGSPGGASGPPPSMSSRCSAVVLATPSTFTAPAHLTPITTHFTSLAFHPTSTALAYGTSLGAVGVWDLPARVQRGEEEREVCDVLAVPLRRQQQKARHAALATERAAHAQAELLRRQQAEAAEQARENERLALKERAAERKARMDAREEARRLKLYVGSLPDLSYAPSPGKVLALEKFSRQAHQAELLAMVEEKGGFIERLDQDLDGRRRRAEERVLEKEQELLESMAPAVQLHGGSDLKPVVKQQKLQSFMARLTRDLDKRKDFRQTADEGRYYRPGSIVPVKSAMPILPQLPGLKKE